MSSTGTSSLAPEITPIQAAEFVIQLRAACAPGTPPERIADLRERLELPILSCNHYLGMLSSWVERGLLIEAASVDASYPSLCRVSKELALGGMRLDWDQACNRAGVQPNSRIDEQALIQLADAVGDACSLDEFVQRFQLSVLSRQPIGMRVLHLKELLAAAPRNHAIRALVKSYETEALATIERNCREAAAAGDMQVLVESLEAIEGLHWQSQFSIEFIDWIRRESDAHYSSLANASYGAIATRIEEAFGHRDLSLLGQLQEEADDVEREHGLVPADSFRERTREALEWASRERNSMREAADHEGKCETLRRAIDQGAGYAEVEPIRAAILAFGRGIPDDLEARFSTVEEQWRASRQRRTRSIVAVAGIALAAAIGAALVLLRGAASNAEADKLAADSMALMSQGHFADAKVLLDAMDPAMLARPLVQAAQKAIQEEAPMYAARRTAVAGLLASAELVARSTDSTQTILQQQLSRLEEAMRKDALLERLEPDERRAALASKARIDEVMTLRLRDLERSIQDEFFSLRRSEAALRRASDRPAIERASEEATTAYLKDLESLSQRLSAFLAKVPAAYDRRGEVQVWMDRISKDITAAQELLPRLARAKALIARMHLVPLSESEYQTLLEELSTQFPDLATDASLGGRNALNDSLAMVRAATAVEHWREAVVPAMRATDTKGVLKVPATRSDANALSPALAAHLAMTSTPYAKLARRLSGMCDLVRSCSSDRIGQAALDEAAEGGHVDLSQFELSNGRFAFVRDGGRGDTQFSGLVSSRADLSPGVPSASLRANPDIANAVRGRRQVTPWSKALQSARDEILGKDAIAVQARWLRLLDEVHRTPMRTDSIAQASVIFDLYRIYVEKLADKEGADRALCDTYARLKVNCVKVAMADWPGLALKSATDTSRGVLQNEALGLLRSLPNFATEAEALQHAWSADLIDPGLDPAPLKLAGLLLPPASGTSARRASPSSLDGTGFYVLQKDPKTGAWTFSQSSFKAGTLESGAPTAPAYSLIYTRN